MMPLNKYIAHTGLCSRRKAEELIREGHVKVSGKIIIEPGHRLTTADVIKVKEKILRAESKIYVLLNKPADCVTTCSPYGDRTTVLDVIGRSVKQRIYPVGRLDQGTTGLLLLTNDGDVAQRLAHPSHGVRKVYHAVLDQPLSYDHYCKIRGGLRLDDGLVTVDNIRYVPGKRKNNVKVAIHIGRYRIIRRLFKALGYNVIKLDRVRYATLSKKRLPLGRWRYLSKHEVETLSGINKPVQKPAIVKS